MTKRNPLLFLVIITIVSAIIRFYQLGNIPNGLATDEADIGYNAYSILRTGADVYGRKYPLFFQSLDDYKPGLIFYLTIPAIKFFGLSDFSVRLAPAIFGILTPALTFILLKLLYSKNNSLPYLSSILVSFAPWNIALSRAMIQYIPIIFLYLVFLILFLFAQRKNIKAHVKRTSFVLSFLVLSITLYVYYAAIVYLPFMIIVPAYIYRDFIKKNIKIFLLALVILSIFSLPAISHYSKKESKSRLNDISIFTADITLPISIAEIKQDKQLSQPFSQIIHNRRLVYASAILDNYVDYFNLDYLFVNAKNIRYFYVHNVGLFYLFELPFFLYGLQTAVKRREKSDLLILSLLLIGPIPAAITLGSPLPHRALLLILAVQLLSAIGIADLLQNLLKKFPISNSHKTFKSGLTLIAILVFIYSLSIYFFIHQYFIHAPREFILGGWFPVIRDAIPKVNNYKADYDKVIFTWSQQRLVPPVYYLFYNQVDPRIIQAQALKWQNEPASYRQIYWQIDNIEFRPIDWQQDKNLINTLFIGFQEEFGQDAQIIDKTFLPDGKQYFVFVKSD